MVYLPIQLASLGGKYLPYNWLVQGVNVGEYYHTLSIWGCLEADIGAIFGCISCKTSIYIEFLDRIYCSQYW